MRNILISGDALEPSPGDEIAQFRSLAVGEPVPDGWRVLSGNERQSTIARVVLRCAVELESGLLDPVGRMRGTGDLAPKPALRQVRGPDGESRLVKVESGK